MGETDGFIEHFQEKFRGLLGESPLELRFTETMGVAWALQKPSA
jgi:hypothetical protein